MRQILSAGTAEPSRVFSPGANLPSVLGAAVTPPYLTFAPAAYFDPSLKMPHGTAPVEPGRRCQASRKQIEWLRRAGVTHVLSFESLEAA